MGDDGGSRRTSSRLVLKSAAAVLLGVLIGVGVFTVSYAGVPGYFGSKPETCANCHVMNREYDAWKAGPHSAAATCNDCHLPHDSVVSKYLVKAEDGFLHAAKFTTGDYPENIVIRDKNMDIANAACLHCHGELTTEMMYTMGADDEDVSCVRCHSGVGHEVRGK